MRTDMIQMGDGTVKPLPTQNSMEIAERTFSVGASPVKPAVKLNGSGWVPFDKRILVLPDEAPETVGGLGLLIAPPSMKEQNKFAMQTGTLVAIGQLAWAEAKYDAQRFGLDVTFPKPGDRIRIGKYAGARFDGADGRDYLMMNDEDILGMPDE